jgi:hypothetical protein
MYWLEGGAQKVKLNNNDHEIHTGDQLVKDGISYTYTGHSGKGKDIKYKLSIEVDTDGINTFTFGKKKSRCKSRCKSCCESCKSCCKKKVK